MAQKVLSGIIRGSNRRAFVCGAKMILLNYETCFDKLPGGAICDTLNVFFPHFPERIELFVHNLFYFHRALNYSEALKCFIATLRDREADRRVSDGFLSFGDGREEESANWGGPVVCKRSFQLCSTCLFNVQLLLNVVTKQAKESGSI